jgi:hypothetical protein
MTDAVSKRLLYRELCDISWMKTIAYQAVAGGHIVVTASFRQVCDVIRRKACIDFLNQKVM